MASPLLRIRVSAMVMASRTQKVWRSIGALTAALGSLVACSDKADPVTPAQVPATESPAPTAGETHDLTVRVVDVAGILRPGTQVRITNGGGVVVRNEVVPSGEATFPLPPDTYTVDVQDGSRALPSARVPLDRDATAVLGEAPSSPVRVVVRTAGETAIPWAWVEIVAPSGARLFRGNDARGEQLLVVPEGRLTLAAFQDERPVARFAFHHEGEDTLVVHEGDGTDPSRSMVEADGTALRLAGKPFRMAGLNIYDANSRGQCGNPLGETRRLDDALKAIGAGQTAFRAWFFQSLAMSQGVRDFAAFDQTLAVARTLGQKVVVTLGNHWGDCDGGAKTKAWYAGGYKSPMPGSLVSYRDWVQEVVSRYKDDPAVLAFQLLNEMEIPLENGVCPAEAASVLAAFVDDVVGIVRARDKRHLVSLGTIGSGQCGTSREGEWSALHARPGVDLCEYHDYGGAEPLPGDRFNGVGKRIEECRALGKPIFAGEVGLKDDVQNRADVFAAKIRAQVTAGAVGVLLWKWTDGEPTSDGFNVRRGDPVLAKLAAP